MPQALPDSSLQREEHGAQPLPLSPPCRFDFEAPNQLRCLVCPEHRLLLLLPERRAAMLALLLKQGQLSGQAPEEAARLSCSSPVH